MCYPGTERCQKANPFILGGKPFYSPVYDPAACPLTLPVQPFLLFFDHSFPDLQVDSGFNSEVTSSFSFFFSLVLVYSWDQLLVSSCDGCLIIGMNLDHGRACVTDEPFPSLIIGMNRGVV